MSQNFFLFESNIDKKLTQQIKAVGAFIQFHSMEQHTFKNVNNCLNTNIYSCLEASGVQSSNPYLNVVHFFQHQSLLEICGSLKLLFSCTGV